MQRESEGHKKVSSEKQKEIISSVMSGSQIKNDVAVLIEKMQKLPRNFIRKGLQFYN